MSDFTFKIIHIMIYMYLYDRRPGSFFDEYFHDFITAHVIKMFRSYTI